MFLIVGVLVVFGSIAAGYLMHGGHLGALLQVNEFLIIGGAAVGSMVIGNSPSVLKRSISHTVALLKPSPFDKAAYADLLQVLYKVFQKARKDGLMGLEADIEAPHQSALFKAHPGFLHHTQAVSLLCDTLKVLLTGAVENHHLDDILTLDLERQHHESMAAPAAISRVSDAMPGFGIVAAVLGVVITMGAIGGSAAEIGEKVAAALVGTFLGILMAYGLLSPIAQAVEARINAEHSYLLVIKSALLAFARGDAPMSAVEFARRNIEPDDRPSFAELETMTRRKAA